MEHDRFFTRFDQQVKQVNQQQDDKVKRAAEWDAAVKAFIPVARPVLERYRDSFKERGVTMEFTADETNGYLSVRFLPPTPDPFRPNERVEVQLVKEIYHTGRYEYVWVTNVAGHGTRGHGGYSGLGDVNAICSVRLLEEVVQKLAENYVYHLVERKF